MSAELSSEMPIENTVVSTETAGTIKKPRVKKPVLAVKLLKYLDFGFQVVQNLHSAELLDDEGLDHAFAQIKLLSSVEDQTAFYSNFLDQSNDTAKILRKFVAAKLKPVPLKKSRAKKVGNLRIALCNKQTYDPSLPTTDKPAKATRVTKPKKVTRSVSDADDDIIGALAQAARGEPTGREPTGREPTVPLRPLPSDNTSREPTDCAADLRPLPSDNTSREPTGREPTGREPTDCAADLRPLPSDNTTDNTTQPVADAKTKKPRKKPQPKAKATVEVLPTELAVELAPPITPEVSAEPVLDTKTKKPRKKPQPSREPTDCIVQLALRSADIRPLPSDDTTDNTTQPVLVTKTKKPRKKPEPKALVSTVPAPEHTTDDILATEITIDQRLFLIDHLNQLYDPISFNLIAHFIPSNNNFILI